MIKRVKVPYTAMAALHCFARVKYDLSAAALRSTCVPLGKRQQQDRMKGSNAFFAETSGTFWLVFGSCGSAVLAAAFPQLGIGFTGVALAFGLAVLTMAYAVGHVSGGHFNPAVTVGPWAGGRFESGKIIPYVLAQVVGAILAAAVLTAIASGKAGWTGGLASNSFGAHSPGGYSLQAALIIEVLMTAFFLIIIIIIMISMGSTDKRAPAGFTPIAIGLGLTLIPLISIPVTNTSVNPARSTGQRFSKTGSPCSNSGPSGLRHSSAECWAGSSIAL